MRNIPYKLVKGIIAYLPSYYNPSGMLIVLITFCLAFKQLSLHARSFFHHSFHNSGYQYTLFIAEKTDELNQNDQPLKVLKL